MLYEWFPTWGQVVSRSWVLYTCWCCFTLLSLSLSLSLFLSFLALSLVRSRSCSPLARRESFLISGAVLGKGLMAVGPWIPPQRPGPHGSKGRH